MEKTVKIIGMTCGHCLKSVENALSKINCMPVSCDLKTGTIIMNSADAVSDSAFVNCIEDLGFDVQSIT